jgi:cysteinyl-tRNA synthetase
MRLLIEKGHAYPAPDEQRRRLLRRPLLARLWRTDRQQRRRHGCRRGRRPARQARPPRLRPVEGTSRPSRRRRAGPHPTASVAPAGTSSARRWPASISATTSTSTAAGSTCASRTTRTSRPSRAPPALDFANYWLHNAWVTMGGEKMSKSLGNSLLIGEVTKQARPLAVRYYLTAAHYRSMIEFHEGSLAEAEAAVDRIEGFLRRALPEGHDRAPSGEEEFPADFAASLDDDLGVSGALAVIHEHVRKGNIAAGRGRARGGADVARLVIAMTDVLGVNPLGDVGRCGRRCSVGPPRWMRWTPWSKLRSRPAPPPARPATSRPPTRSATNLPPAGIQVEDTSAGARWSLVKSGRRALMAGNQRTRRGAQAGLQEGRHRRVRRPAPPRALEGRGPTPKAVDRPNHKAHKQAARGGQARSAGRAATAAAARRLRQAPRSTKASSEMVAGRNCGRRGAARRRPRLDPLCREPDRRRRPRAGGDQARRGTAAYRCWKPRGPNSTGSPTAPCTRASRCRCRRMRVCAPERSDRPGTPGIPLIVALDGITDPRNLGAIVRSVAAFGGHGVVVPARRSVGMTASAWKTSAGAAARIPVAQATNLTGRWRTIARRASSSSGSTWRATWSCPHLDLAASRSSSSSGPRARACLGWFARPAIRSSRSRCRAPSSPSTPASPRASRSMRSPDDDAEYRQLPAVGVPRLLGSE